jgi:hypothetical protein
MLRIRAATPQRCSPLASTRTTDARQHTHRFSPPVISFGKIRIISSALPSLKCASLYKKIPLLLKSRVQPLASIVPCSDLIVTGRARLRRFCVRRSGLDSGMEEGEYHNSATECIAARGGGRSSRTGCLKQKAPLIAIERSRKGIPCRSTRT